MNAHIQEQEENLNQPFVPLSKLRKWIEANKEMPEDTPVTFEFMMTLCFPTILDTIQETMRECYDKGFQHGVAAANGQLEEALRADGVLADDEHLVEVTEPSEENIDGPQEDAENECEDDT